MKDVYFDTSTLITEVFAPNTNSNYNTTNGSYTPWISPVVRQELFHIMAQKNAHSTRGSNHSYSTAWKQMSQFLMKTQMIDTTSTELLRNYKALENIIHRKFQNIPQQYDSDFPGSADLMHFSYAKVKQCDILVTTDDDYCDLKKISNGSDVGKIVVLDPISHKKKTEVTL